MNLQIHRIERNILFACLITFNTVPPARAVPQAPPETTGDVTSRKLSHILILESGKASTLTLR